MDLNAWKGVIIELLLPHLAFQDSCRLLLFLGLMNHRINGFDSWAEIEGCVPNPDGSQLESKASAQDSPVFAEHWTTTRTETSLTLGTKLTFQCSWLTFLA